MRKIVVSEFLSADGVMEAPDTWQFPFQTEELGAITEGQIRDADDRSKKVADKRFRFSGSLLSLAGQSFAYAPPRGG